MNSGIRTVGLAVLFLASISACASAAVVLPIEVLGSDGFTQSVQVNVPSVNGGQGVYLWLQMHGLEYDTEASVQVNNGAWMPLNNHSVTFLGMGGVYGGIGGGFARLTMRLALPNSLIVAGQNTVRFKFNGTDGDSSGFRVLNFNLQQPLGKNLISSSQFVQDNPAAWRAPLTNAADIAAGQTLWRTATLQQPSPGKSPRILKAHCADCHTQDGRDLKYFNYSNQSIEARAAFHGLTATQGLQIASYIRSLNLPAPGRPWNPPYQPGPGLDSKPVNQWAAGAGLGAQLASDAAMLPYVSPTLSPADFNPNANASPRNTPIAFQLPDWNHWLPRTHPLDAWGSSFSSDPAFQDYLSLRTQLSPNNLAAYKSSTDLFGMWVTTCHDFESSVAPSPNSSAWSNPATAKSLYSVALWRMVKQWELNQEFGLEGMAQGVFGPQADSRAWYSSGPFETSPNFNHIPDDASGIGNGAPVTFLYHNLMWYYLQVVLNDGNRSNKGSVDWGYMYGVVSAMDNQFSPQPMLTMFLLKKALQASQNGYGPQYGSAGYGWNPRTNNPAVMTADGPLLQQPMNQSTRAALINGYVTNWLAVANSFTPQQFYQGDMFSRSDSIQPGSPDSNIGSGIATAASALQFLGLRPDLAKAMIDWGAKMWPNYNWNIVRNASCSWNQGLVHCTDWP